MDWYTESEGYLVAEIYQEIILLKEPGEFLSVAMKFQDLVNEQKITNPQSQMSLSALLMAKQNSLAVEELYDKVESIMSIFKPDQEMMQIEQEVQQEETFEGENIVSLKNWKNKGKLQ